MPKIILPEVAILAAQRLESRDGEVCCLRHCTAGAEWWLSAWCLAFGGEIKIFLCRPHFDRFQLSMRGS